MANIVLPNGVVVHDADTFYSDGQSHRVVGMDAPEVANQREGTFEAPGGEAATRAAAAALSGGYTLSPSGEYDRHGRELTRVAPPGGGTSLSSDLIAGGAAYPRHWADVDDKGASLSALTRPGADKLVGGGQSLSPGADNDVMQFAIEQARSDRIAAFQRSIATGELGRRNASLGALRDPTLSDNYEYVDAAFARGVDNMQGTFYGFADALGQVAGVDVLSEWGQEGVARNVVEAMRSPARVESYEDIDGLADVGIYALEAVGEFAPQLLADVSAGLATGGTGVVAKKLLLAGAGKALLRKTGGSMATAAPRKLGTHGWEAFAPGAKAGAFASAYMQNTGETQNQFVAEGIEAPGEALLIGTGKAALDYAGLYVALRQAFKRFNKADAGDALKLGDWLKSSVGATLTAFGAESVTEGAQTLMDELAIQGHKPEHEINWTSVVDAMLKGGIGGGTATAAGQVASGLLSMGGQTAAEAAPEQAGTDSADPLADKIKAMGNTDPTPEPAADLVAQVAHPNKPVTFIPPANKDETQQILDEARAMGAEVHTLDLENGGTLVANDPAALQGVPTNPTSAELAQVLGMQNDRAALAEAFPDQELPVVVVTDAEQRVLHSEVVAPGQEGEVAANLQQRYPDAAVQVTTPEAVVTDRAKRRLPKPAPTATAPTVLEAKAPAQGDAVSATQAAAQPKDEASLRSALTEAGLDPEQFTREVDGDELVVIDTGTGKPSAHRTRQYAERVRAAIAGVVQEIASGEGKHRPEYPAALRQIMGIPEDTRAYGQLKAAVSTFVNSVDWQQRLADGLAQMSPDELHQMASALKLSALERSAKTGKMNERIGRQKKREFDTAAAVSALAAMAPVQRVEQQIEQEQVAPVEKDTAPVEKEAAPTGFVGRLRSELLNNELAREALYGVRTSTRALRTSAREAWSQLRLRSVENRQAMADALAERAEELYESSGMATVGVEFHKDNEALDDKAYRTDRVAGVSKEEDYHRARDMQRLAAQLMRSDLSPRAQIRAVREAVRALLPPSEFGLRKTTVRERAEGQGFYTQDLDAETSQKIEKLAEDGKLEEIAADILITAAIRRVTDASDYVVEGPAAELMRAKVYGGRAIRDFPTRAIDALLLRQAGKLIASRELGSYTEAMEYLRELAREGDPAVVEVILRATVDDFRRELRNGETLLEHLQDFAQRDSELDRAGHKEDPDVSARRSFSFYTLFSRVFSRIPQAVRERYKRRQGQRPLTETHRVVGLDFETFYDSKSGYSLKGGMSPDAYIAYPRFKVLLATVSEPGKPPRLLRTDGEIRAFLDELQGSDKPVALAMHNAGFDARVLRSHFGFMLGGDSRYVDTLALFRAAAPKNPGHKLGDMEQFMRDQGVQTKEKDSAALVAVDGVSDLSTLPAEKLKAFESYALNDSELVVQAIQHFDPDTTPDTGYIDVADRVLRGELDPAAPVAASELAAADRAPDATNNTRATNGKNLVVLDYFTNGHWAKARFDLIRLAAYAQGGEHAPANALEALNNLNANLSRLMTSDVLDSQAKGMPVAGIKAVGYLSPDRVFYIDGSGRGVTIGDALAMRGRQMTTEEQASKLEQRRLAAKQKLDIIDKLVKGAISLLMTEDTRPVQVDALMLWHSNLTGEKQHATKKTGKAEAYKTLGANDLNPLDLGLTAAESQALNGGKVVNLFDLANMRGELLGELGTVSRELRSLEARWVDDRDRQERAEAKAHVAEEYDEWGEADERRLENEVEREGMASEEGPDGERAAREAALRAEADATPGGIHELKDMGRELALRDPAFAEAAQQLESARARGTGEVREGAAQPAAKKAAAALPARVQVLLRTLRRGVPALTNVSRKAREGLLPTVAAARQRARQMMVGPRWGARPALQQLAERFIAELVLQGVPVGGARVVAFTAGDVVADAQGAKFGPAFTDGAQRLMIDDDKLLRQMAARAQQGGSFYFNNGRGEPLIFVDVSTATGWRGRARAMQDLAHELGHLVFDRTYGAMTEEEVAALEKDMHAALPGTERLEGRDKDTALHEFFAHKFVEAATDNAQQVLDGLSGPVATLVRALLSMVRDIWSSLVQLATREAPAFAAFAERIFAGEFVQAPAKGLMAASKKVRSVSDIQRVAKALHHLKTARSGLHLYTSADDSIGIRTVRSLSLPSEDFDVDDPNFDLVAHEKAFPDVKHIPLGHVARMIPGLEPTLMVAYRDGQPVASLILQIDPANGEIVALNDIKVWSRGNGRGEEIIRAILAGKGTKPLRLIDCVEPAKGFWEKMGVTFYDANDDAQLTWADYARKREQRDREASERGAVREVRPAASGSDVGAGGRGDSPVAAGHAREETGAGYSAEFDLPDDLEGLNDDELDMFGIVRDAAGIQKVAQLAKQRLQMAATQGKQGWRDGNVAKLWRSVTSTASSRIAHFDPLLSRQLFQSANTDSTGTRAYEQHHRALRARLTGVMLQVRESLGAEQFQAGFEELATGAALTEAGEAVRKLLGDLQTGVREAGLKSVLFRATEPPMVFDREAVGARQAELELLLAQRGMPADMVRHVIDGVLHSDALPDTNMAPGLPVGEHVSSHALTRYVPRQELQKLGFLLASHERAMFHWIEGVSRRAAWDSAFGDYGPADPALAQRYFGEDKLTTAQHKELVDAGILRKDGSMFHTNAKFVERLNMVEQAYGQSARREVLELVNGALGRHPMGMRMPDGYRKAQDTILSWLGRTILMWSGVASIPELGLSAARAHGKVSMAGAFKDLREARAFARDMGVVMAHSTEYLAWATDQYQTPMNQKIDRWFFFLNGNKLVTDTSRALSLAVGSQYLIRAAKEGDHAVLARLNVSAEQVLAWEAAGRPRWSMDQPPLERQNNAAVVDALNQFVGEASLAPSRFQATHWGNNPYMRVIWQLKHFLFAYGDTVLGNVWREGKRRFKGDASMLMVMAPALVLMAATFPLALASGQARDWIRRLNGEQSRYQGEEALGDRLIDGVFYSGMLGPLDILFGMARQAGWGNLPGAVGPSLGVAWRSLEGLNIGSEQDADFAAAARVLIPAVSQNKGLWPALHLD